MNIFHTVADLITILPDTRLLAGGVILLGAIGYGISRLLRRYSIGFSSRDTLNSPKNEASDVGSLLLSFFSAGHLLQNLAEQQKDGVFYSIYFTMPSTSHTSGLSYADAGVTIYALALPFNTTSHIVGMSAKNGAEHVKLSNFIRAHGLHDIQLEGDFDQFCSIYAPNDQQEAVRSVLTPTLMSLIEDYLKNNLWEINNAELYFVVADVAQAVGLMQATNTFIAQIKPALLPGQAGAASVHHELPYGVMFTKICTCPFCQDQMTAQETWQYCPNGHGLLVTGRDVERLHNHEITIAIPIVSLAEQPTTLPCPNCHGQLQITAYEDSDVQIYSCDSCPARFVTQDTLGFLQTGKLPIKH